ncbi:hypothetical protein [Caulobacter sp. RL271]|uniref:Uncharacterized protein n=1 Tax=Caulobacter segnis TaxID=88688 RepID=A0ABY5A0H5_9CAUL|nr:hypothetical protein [Caulobacter segnis]USQ98435.1 hypothetical protein MZV50_13185 [Caulobacter segnis]
MLVAVQVPIVDLRPFVAETARLPSPGWPAPEADREFLRAFGAVRNRPSGGLNGWLGEALICEVDRGLRFVGVLPQALLAGRDGWSLRVVYRRFYADGLAMGKFEVGFDVRPTGPQKRSPDLADLVAAILNLNVAIGRGANRALGAAGADLARAYARATTPHGQHLDQAERFVLAGKPCVVIEHSGRPLLIPAKARTSQAVAWGQPDVVFWHQRQFGVDVPVWLLARFATLERDKSRRLRLYLNRLHADTEALAKILKALSIGAVAPAPRSIESDRLQRMLMDAAKHQRQLGQRVGEHLEAFHHEALWHRDHALPGYYDGLLKRVELLDPRPAVRAVLEQYIVDRQSQDARSTLFVLGDHVVNVVNNGTAGIVGGTVDVKDSTVIGAQTTMGSTSADAITQLQELAKVLKAQAKEPDEEVAATAVDNAAQKLAAGDEAGALAWLKRSGAWALKIAESVSAKLAAEMIIRAST